MEIRRQESLERKDHGVNHSRPLKALLALFTVITFLTTSVIWAPDSFAAAQAIRVPASAAPEVLIPYQAQLDPGIRFSIPQELGTLQYFKAGKGPMVVHLQTAHGHYQAQKQIQALLHHLDKQYGIRTLLVEGSAFKLDPGILNFFPEDPKLTQKVNDALTKQALVKGPELYLLDELSGKTSPVPQAYGIENLEAYRENGLSFVDVLKEKKKTEKFLASMNEGIERLSAAYLNDALRNYLKQLESFEKNQLPFDAWLSLMKKESLKRLKLDLTQPGAQLDWPMLVRIFKVQELSAKFDKNAFVKEREKFLKALRHFFPSSHAQIEQLLKSEQMSQQLPDPETSMLFEDMVKALPRDFDYEAYPNVRYFIGRLLLQSELKAPELMEETQRLSAKIMEKLAKTQAEKDLVVLLKDYRLLQKLFALELTPANYDAIVGTRDSGLGDRIRPSEIAKRFKQAGSVSRVRDVKFQHVAELDRLFAAAMKFYAGVKERDGLMEQMIEKRLQETGADKVAVITGGFHSEPFKNYFSSRDYSYALISPRITSGDEAGHQAYVENMLNFAQRTTHITQRNVSSSAALNANESTLEDAFLSDLLHWNAYGRNADAARAEVRQIVSAAVAGRAEVRTQVNPERMRKAIRSMNLATLQVAWDMVTDAQIGTIRDREIAALKVIERLLGVYGWDNVKKLLKQAQTEPLIRERIQKLEDQNKAQQEALYEKARRSVQSMDQATLQVALDMVTNAQIGTIREREITALKIMERLLGIYGWDNVKKLLKQAQTEPLIRGRIQVALPAQRAGARSETRGLLNSTGLGTVEYQRPGVKFFKANRRFEESQGESLVGTMIALPSHLRVDVRHLFNAQGNLTMTDRATNRRTYTPGEGEAATSDTKIIRGKYLSFGEAMSASLKKDPDSEPLTWLDFSNNFGNPNHVSFAAGRLFYPTGFGSGSKFEQNLKKPLFSFIQHPDGKIEFGYVHYEITETKRINDYYDEVHAKAFVREKPLSPEVVVFSAIPLVVDGKPANLSSAIRDGMFQDLRHLFALAPAKHPKNAKPGDLALPQVPEEIRAGVYFGFDELIAHNYEKAAQAFYGPVSLSMKLSVTPGGMPVSLTREQVRQVFARDGYVEETDSENIERRQPKQGKYLFVDQEIIIYLKPAPYPHLLVGETKDGEIFVQSIGGISGRVGITIKEALDYAKTLGLKNLMTISQGTGSLIGYIPEGVAPEPDALEKGYKAIIEGSEGRGAGSAVITIKYQNPNPPPEGLGVSETSARAEMRKPLDQEPRILPLAVQGEPVLIKAVFLDKAGTLNPFDQQPIEPESLEQLIETLKVGVNVTVVTADSKYDALRRELLDSLMDTLLEQNRMGLVSSFNLVWGLEKGEAIWTRFEADPSSGKGYKAVEKKILTNQADKGKSISIMSKELGLSNGYVVVATDAPKDEAMFRAELPASVKALKVYVGEKDAERMSRLGAIVTPPHLKYHAATKQVLRDVVFLMSSRSEVRTKSEIKMNWWVKAPLAVMMGAIVVASVAVAVLFPPLFVISITKPWSQNLTEAFVESQLQTLRPWLWSYGTIAVALLIRQILMWKNSFRKIGADRISSLSRPQLLALTEKQIMAFTAAQLHALTGEQHKWLMGSDQERWLDARVGELTTQLAGSMATARSEARVDLAQVEAVDGQARVLKGNEARRLIEDLRSAGYAKIAEPRSSFELTLLKLAIEGGLPTAFIASLPSNDRGFSNEDLLLVEPSSSIVLMVRKKNSDLHHLILDNISQGKAFIVERQNVTIAVRSEVRAKLQSYFFAISSERKIGESIRMENLWSETHEMTILVSLYRGKDGKLLLNLWTNTPATRRGLTDGMSWELEGPEEEILSVFQRLREPVAKQQLQEAIERDLMPGDFDWGNERDQKKLTPWVEKLLKGEIVPGSAGQTDLGQQPPTESRSEVRGKPTGGSWEDLARARISEIQRKEQEERARISAEMKREQEAIRSMTTPQLLVLTERKVMKFTAAQIQALTPAQLHVLKGTDQETWLKTRANELFAQQAAAMKKRKSRSEARDLGTIIFMVAGGLFVAEVGFVALRAWMLHRRLSRFPNAVRMIKEEFRKFVERTENKERQSLTQTIYLADFTQRIVWRKILDSKLALIEQAVSEGKRPVLQFVSGGNEIELEWTKQTFEVVSSWYFPGGGEDQLVSSEPKGWYGSIEVSLPADSRSETRFSPEEEAIVEKAMKDLKIRWGDLVFVSEIATPRRVAAVERLGAIKNPFIVPVLNDLLAKERNGDVWFAIAAALWQAGDTEIRDRVMAALEDDSPFVRQRAAQLLGENHETRAVPVLTLVLRDDSKKVRAAAAEALEWITTTSPPPASRSEIRKIRHSGIQDGDISGVVGAVQEFLDAERASIDEEVPLEAQQRTWDLQGLLRGPRTEQELESEIEATWRIPNSSYHSSRSEVRDNGKSGDNGENEKRKKERETLRKELEPVFEAFGLYPREGDSTQVLTYKEAMRLLIEGMTLQHKHMGEVKEAVDPNAPSADLRIRHERLDELPLTAVSKTGNAVPTSMVTDDETLKRYGVFQYDALFGDPAQNREYLTAAAQTSLRWNILDGGIGESLMREEWLLNKGLRARLKNILSAGENADTEYQSALKVLKEAEEQGETDDILAALRELERIYLEKVLIKKLRDRMKDILSDEKKADAPYQKGLASLRAAEERGETKDVILALKNLEWIYLEKRSRDYLKNILSAKLKKIDPAYRKGLASLRVAEKQNKTQDVISALKELEAIYLEKRLRARLKPILTAGEKADVVYQKELALLAAEEGQVESKAKGQRIGILKRLEKMYLKMNKSSQDPLREGPLREGPLSAEPLQVKMGAKSTDLGRIETIRDKEYFVGDAELRFLFMAMADPEIGGKLGKLICQPIVNYQSEISYQQLLEQPYLWDVIEGRFKPGTKKYRTYEEALNEAGVEFPEMLMSTDLPKFEIRFGASVGTPTTDSKHPGKRQTAGHGQPGFYFMVDFVRNKPVKEKSHPHFLMFFSNGDNNKATPDPLIAGFVAKRKIPIVKITTPTTPIDRKGGKEVFRVILQNGKIIIVLDQLEEIEAIKTGQAEMFYSLGQRNGIGEEGKQLFNTNMFYFNVELLHPILNEMLEIVKRGNNKEEAEFWESIMPLLFDKSAKKQTIDGKDYVSMDSALGYVVHRLNTFYSIDPRFEALRKQYGPQLLYYINENRDAFAPKKGPADQYLQEATDFFGPFDEKIRNFREAVRGLTPPAFDFTDPFEKDGKPSDSKFWSEVQHWLDSLGGSFMREMRSLKVEGRVTLRGCEYSGDIAIFNRKGRKGPNRLERAERVVLSSGDYRKKLKALGCWNYTLNRPKLENVQVTIDPDGELSIKDIKEVRTEEGGRIARDATMAKELFERLREKGVTVLGDKCDIKNRGALTVDIPDPDNVAPTTLNFGKGAVVNGINVNLHLGGQNVVEIEPGTEFGGLHGLTLDLFLERTYHLHIAPGVLQNVIERLQQKSTTPREEVLGEYEKHLEEEELDRAFYIRRIVESLILSASKKPEQPGQKSLGEREPVLIENTKWVKAQIDRVEDMIAEARKHSRSEMREVQAWFTNGRAFTYERMIAEKEQEIDTLRRSIADAQTPEAKRLVPGYEGKIRTAQQAMGGYQQQLFTAAIPEPEVLARLLTVVPPQTLYDIYRAARAVLPFDGVIQPSDMLRFFYGVPSQDQGAMMWDYVSAFGKFLAENRGAPSAVNGARSKTFSEIPREAFLRYFALQFVALMQMARQFLRETILEKVYGANVPAAEQRQSVRQTVKSTRLEPALRHTDQVLFLAVFLRNLLAAADQKAATPNTQKLIAEAETLKDVLVSLIAREPRLLKVQPRPVEVLRSEVRFQVIPIREGAQQPAMFGVSIFSAQSGSYAGAFVAFTRPVGEKTYEIRFPDEGNGRSAAQFSVTVDNQGILRGVSDIRTISSAAKSSSAVSLVAPGSKKTTAERFEKIKGSMEKFLRSKIGQPWGPEIFRTEAVPAVAGQGITGSVFGTQVPKSRSEIRGEMVDEALDLKPAIQWSPKELQGFVPAVAEGLKYWTLVLYTRRIADVERVKTLRDTFRNLHMTYEVTVAANLLKKMALELTPAQINKLTTQDFSEVISTLQAAHADGLVLPAKESRGLDRYEQLETLANSLDLLKIVLNKLKKIYAAEAKKAQAKPEGLDSSRSELRTQSAQALVLPGVAAKNGLMGDRQIAAGLLRRLGLEVTSAQIGQLAPQEIREVIRVLGISAANGGTLARAVGSTGELARYESRTLSTGNIPASLNTILVKLRRIQEAEILEAQTFSSATQIPLRSVLESQDIEEIITPNVIQLIELYYFKIVPMRLYREIAETGGRETLLRVLRRFMSVPVNLEVEKTPGTDVLGAIFASEVSLEIPEGAGMMSIPTKEPVQALENSGVVLLGQDVLRRLMEENPRALFYLLKEYNAFSQDKAPVLLTVGSPAIISQIRLALINKNSGLKGLEISERGRLIEALETGQILKVVEPAQGKNEAQVINELAASNQGGIASLHLSAAMLPDSTKGVHFAFGENVGAHDLMVASVLAIVLKSAADLIFNIPDANVRTELLHKFVMESLPGVYPQKQGSNFFVITQIARLAQEFAARAYIATKA